ncbi:MAG: zinc-binding dehydrogenase [Cyanobacteria bacterium P01_H01_bin.74]
MLLETSKVMQSLTPPSDAKSKKQSHTAMPPQNSPAQKTTQKDTPKKNMMAARFYAPNDVRYERCDMPVPKEGELVVKVQAALTCGTDLKCYRRGHPVLLKTLPSLFGHEFSGTVAAVGPGAVKNNALGSAFAVGDRVVCANSAPCYACYYCHKGQTNLCDHLDLLNGAYADYILIPKQIAQYNTYAVPETLDFEIAAFSEPLAVCLHGEAQAVIQPGDRVAVLGLGPIGQLMAAVCVLKGAHVTAMARTESKLELAKAFGQVHQVVHLRAMPDAAEIIKHYTPDARGFDVVIEAVGLPETWEKSLQLVRKGGRVNWFGGCPSGSTVSVDTRRVHYEQITLLSSFHHTPVQFQKAVQLLASGEIDAKQLISARQPLSQFESALQQVEAGQAIKVALMP